ncbi:hypothetical protein SFUMM280S_01006 [Streptomyces fumanus]
MAVIHRTYVKPTKLELLTSWLPSRPWYRGGAGEPELTKAGGFRLDDPEGEVGIECTSHRRPAPSSRCAPGPLDEHGRGLALVGALADHWEVVDRKPPGKTVHTRSRCLRSPARTIDARGVRFYVPIRSNDRRSK